MRVRPVFSIVCLLNILLMPSFTAKESSTLTNTSLHIAVASNFTSTLKQLVNSYHQPAGLKIIISSASTGKLATQIRYGAPFDIFLAADTERPKLLINENIAYKDSFYIYAQGQLALISKHNGASSAIDLLRSGVFKQLAIANPKTAPYGLAAKNWLTTAGFEDPILQYVIGENINQTWQFFQQGGVDAALVAMSQILLTERTNFHYWLLPQTINRQLKQGAVILKSSSKRAIAEQFMHYLKSDEAAKIIESAGYKRLKE